MKLKGDEKDYGCAFLSNKMVGHLIRNMALPLSVVMNLWSRATSKKPVESSDHDKYIRSII